MKENALQLRLERVSLVEIVAGFGHISLRSGVVAGGGSILQVRSRRRAQLFVATTLMGYGALAHPGRRLGRRGLPLLMVNGMVGVYGEYIGFVDVMRRPVGVEGADAELVFGRQVVDGNGFAGSRIGLPV